MQTKPTPNSRPSAADERAHNLSPGDSPPSASVRANENVVRNIEQIARLEQRDQLAMSRSDRIASWVAGFSGSMLYVWLHVAWFTLWIVLNRGLLGVSPFDPFPFNFLTMIVSLEAIFLSTFVLISQNRQALTADRRAKVDLQVNLIGEQETTKLLQMVAEIQDFLGMTGTDDHEVKQLQRPTHVEHV